MWPGHASARARLRRCALPVGPGPLAARGYWNVLNAKHGKVDMPAFASGCDEALGRARAGSAASPLDTPAIHWPAMSWTGERQPRMRCAVAAACAQRRTPLFCSNHAQALAGCTLSRLSSSAGEPAVGSLFPRLLLPSPV